MAGRYADSPETRGERVLGAIVRRPFQFCSLLSALCGWYGSLLLGEGRVNKPTHRNKTGSSPKPRKT